MIDILDLMNKGRTHLPFNAAFIRVISKIYQDEAIRFVAHASHIEAMAEMGSLPNNVLMEVLPEAASAAERDASIRNTGAIAYLRSTKLAPNVVLMGARPWFLETLRSDTALLARAAFDIVFHASLAEPARWRSRNPFVRRKDLFGVLGRHFPPTVRFVLLEQAIEENVRRIVRSSTRTTVLEHPAERTSIMPKRMKRDGPLQIAFIGAPTRPKGFPIFREAARNNNGRFDFHCIGRATESYDHTDDVLFATPPSVDKLSQMAFDSAVMNADLVCLPLDPVHYGWSASGTLLDCVRFGIPPVTVRTAVVDKLVQKYGPFGYYADSVLDTPALISKLDRARLNQDSQGFRAALDRIAADRSIEALASTFRLNSA